MQVYFIQVGEDGPIKIGRTNDVANRLRGLQTAHHRELKVVHVETPAKGQSGKLEADLQLQFRDLCIRGEWFRPWPALLEYIGKAPITWEKITAMDEDIRNLYQEALIAEYEPGDFKFFCPRDHVWFREFKPRFKRLVGFHRPHPPKELQTCEAYDIAYHKIADAIPCSVKCKKVCVERT